MRGTRAPDGRAGPSFPARGPSGFLGAGTGQNRTTQTDNRESALGGADEALFYRARLILGDSLPRPQR